LGGGAGTGQTRLVTGWDPSSRTLSLENPLDEHFSPAVNKDRFLTFLRHFNVKMYHFTKTGSEQT
jgi:hypothetical protein